MQLVTLRFRQAIGRKEKKTAHLYSSSRVLPHAGYYGDAAAASGASRNPSLVFPQLSPSSSQNSTYDREANQNADSALASRLYPHLHKRCWCNKTHILWHSRRYAHTYTKLKFLPCYMGTHAVAKSNFTPWLQSAFAHCLGTFLLRMSRFISCQCCAKAWRGKAQKPAWKAH